MVMMIVSRVFSFLATASLLNFNRHIFYSMGQLSPSKAIYQSLKAQANQ